MNKLGFTIFFVFVCLVSKAQDYYFRNYQVNDGISSNTITCVTQDKKGFIWFGTRNGLNRFDGTHFKIFMHDSGDSLSIGNNSILSLCADHTERLWVGTYKGLYLYDAVHETFVLIPDIPQSEVRSLTCDKNSNIWIRADNRLFRYALTTHAITEYKTSGSYTSAVRISENGTVWSATVAGVFRKYEPSKDRFVDYQVTTLHEGRSPFFVQTFYPVSDTILLFSTFTQTFLFNINTQKLSNVFESSGLENNIQVHEIIRQSDNEFWLGTENGLCMLNLATGKYRLIKKQIANPYALNDNVINALYKDAEGSTWIGTFFGGLNFYSAQLNQFQKYFPLPGTNTLSGNLVHEITEDKYKNLWVGTEDAGLNKIDTKTGSIQHFEPDGKGSISYMNIHGLLADDTRLWIGTYEHGLDVMDVTTGKVIHHYEKSYQPNSLSSNFIVTLYKTREGDILIGTWNGLFKYDKQADDFKLMPYFKRQAQAIHEDEEGTIWVCSYGNGVYFYNPVSGKKGSFRYDSSNVNSLPSNYVNNLFEDSQHNMWFCTEVGLCKYNFKTKKIDRITHLEGLQENQVFKVLEDATGNLWVSTSKGLVKFDTRKHTTLIYNTLNGLLSDQFNYNSGFKADDGSFYFGTVKGMIHFNPLYVNKTNFVAPVYITGIQVNNKELPIRNNDSATRQSVLYARNITLPYDSSTISLDVASLSFITPSLNQYDYKMDGLDREWTHITSNRKIYYTKLPPGNYTFRLRGAGNSKVWNEKETTLGITVLPPVWATWWAYVLYALAATGIFLLILRYYYLALRETNKRKVYALEREKEREIYSAKIEFFTNITHEIRTPLTLIKLPLEKLLKTVSDSSGLYENLTMINKNTNRLIDLTDQLLDFRKAEANNYSLNFIRTDITQLLKELFTTYKPAAEQKGVSLKLELPRVSLHASVDVEAFRKIVSNLFSNAIKYCNQTVIVRLQSFSSDDKIFHIQIRNDGFLIPYELKEKIFEPFYRVKETEKNAGTGIGLPLARSLAELHKGVLDLQQPVDKFNIFLLSLPIYQEHELDILNDYETIETETLVADEEDNKQLQTGDIKVLLVEDNKEILQFIRKELQHTYTILKAGNGEEALQIIETENIQLVVSDIMMPVMDGIELCRKMKQDLRYSHIPIVLLTAKNTLQSKIEGLEVGADAYIEKPFALEHLQAQIQSLLTNRNIVKEYFAHSPLTHIRGIACSKPDKDFLEQLQQHINDNIADTDIDVDKLSKMMNMSRPTFYRKIKGLSDLSPNELINLSRLKKAAELLANSSYKINEVANMVGYTLQSNFARDFHKQFGVTPSGYVSNLAKDKKYT